MVSPCRTPESVTRVMPAGSRHVPFLNHPEAFHAALVELAGRE